MLHGLGMDSRYWLPFIAPLLHRFQFFLPDCRGSGQSARVPVNQPDLFNNLKEDTEDLLNHLQLKNYLLVGYSMGASTALHLAQDGGFKNVCRYLHIDQSPCIINRTDWKYGLLGYEQTAFLLRLQQVHDLLAEYPQQFTFAQLPNMVKQQATDEFAHILGIAAGNPAIVSIIQQAAKHPTIFAKLIGDMSLGNLRAYLNTYANNTNDYRTCFDTSPAPITCFIGEKSPLYSFQGQRLMAEKKAVRRSVIFSNSGHMPQADEPIKFAKALARFLKEG